MPSFERGVYEPKSDDIRVFDEDEQEIDEEGSRLPLLIVIALLVLFAFGGVVWLAYSQGVQRGRADAPRMLVAAQGPVKEAAPGSSDAGRSLKIYQQPAPADDDAADSDSVPPPPTAATKPAPSAMAAKPETAPATRVTAKPEATAPKVTAMTAPPATKPVEKPAPSVTKPPATVSKPAETATAAPTPLVSKPAPETVKPEAVAPVAGGAYALQIGAYKSQEEADTAWKSYKSKHPIVGGYSEDVRKADLGDKGIWYRLRISSFGDKASAAAFCDKLKADGGTCLVAK